MLEKVRESVRNLVNKGIRKSEIGVILGTGLGNMVSKMENKMSIPYAEIPNFPEATVDFHTGEFVQGTLAGKNILVMNGRFHFYEGHSLQEVTFPVRVMKGLGVETLLISNACGSVNPEFEKASLMIIDDHINMLPGNPLVGKNYPEFGPRILDMSRPYNPQLNGKIENIASALKINLHKGVYVAWTGPSLETRAEYKFIRIIGADVVGMSTVPEVIVANHMGMKVAAIAVITDLCDPENLEPLNMNEVIRNAAKAEKDLSRIFEALISEL
jgi:purine-nucleoside phosphorylase